MKGFIGKVVYLLVCCVIGSAIVPVFEHFSPATTEAQAIDDTLVDEVLMADLEAAFASSQEE